MRAVTHDSKPGDAGKGNFRRRIDRLRARRLRGYFPVRDRNRTLRYEEQGEQDRIFVKIFIGLGLFLHVVPMKVHLIYYYCLKCQNDGKLEGDALTRTTENNGQNPSTQFQIISHGVTDTGHVRTKNEDSILVHEEENVWVVADGMGGHHAGDFASQTITNNIGLFKQHASLDDSILLLEENILNSNAIIRKKSGKLGRSATIGSTVVCVYVWQNLLFTLWAGDSRLYRYRDARLERLTEDHSYVEELVRMGKLEANEAEEHPAANVVLRAVGIDDQLYIDFEYFELQQGDIFIICSDGLYKDLEEARIEPIIEGHSNDMRNLADALLKASLAAGGTDNTSIITMKIGRKE